MSGAIKFINNLLVCKMNKNVYVAKPDLTIYHDTFLKCELINKETDGECKIKIISVHTGRGGLLTDLTAEHEDEIISVPKEHIFETIEAVKQTLLDSK